MNWFMPVAFPLWLYVALTTFGLVGGAIGSILLLFQLKRDEKKMK